MNPIILFAIVIAIVTLSVASMMATAIGRRT